MGTQSNRVSYSAALLLLTATAVLCFGPDGSAADLGAATPESAGESGGDAKGNGNGDLLTPWDQQGLNVIKAYADYNKKLQNTEKGLREKLANPPDTVKGIEYHTVPGYKYKFLGRTMTQKSRSECELVCSSYSACKSYSYNAKDRTCVWSMSKIKYDMDYSIWIKKATPEGNPNKLYSELPGLFIQDRLEPMQQMVGGLTGIKGDIAKPKAANEHTSFEECKYQCTNTPTCRTFSFSSAKTDCVLSAIAMHYEPDWTYYEKEESLETPPHVKEHQKENTEKEELKAQWIAGSTAKARAEQENIAKVKKQLTDSKNEETNARADEQRAFAASTVDAGRCNLADAEAKGGAKRNAALMAEVEKADSKTARVRNQRMSAEQGLEKATTYESRKKADLKLAFYDVGEVQNKAAEIKEDEKAEKKRNHGYQENKEKACGASDLTEATYKSKESALKRTEATQKMLVGVEDLGQKHDELATSDAELMTAESDERKAKMVIAIKKTTLEGNNKISSAADSEIVKKESIQTVEKSEEVVRKASAHSDQATHAVLMKKEAFQKIQESTRKQKEKNEKSENLVNSRKREGLMKAETVEVRKKLKVKKESDGKNEHSSKLAKNHENSEKKSNEEREKGESDLKEMTADEMSSKEQLQSEEKKYKDVQNTKETNTKEEVRHKKRLRDLDQDEQDSKYKTRRNALMKRTLAENEAEAKKHAQDAEQAEFDATKKAGADEQKEKASAVALKKASTESDTKTLLRSELQMKAVLTQSNEEATKTQQQKMLASEDLVQAAAKQQAEACVHICLEGLEVKKKEFDMLAAKPVNATTPTPAPAVTPPPSAPPAPREDVTKDGYGGGTDDENIGAVMSLLEEDPESITPVGGDSTTQTGVKTEPTAADKEVASKAQAVLTEQNEMGIKMASMPPKVNLPKIESFTFNGCEC